jgi:hypothetical protein
VNHPRDSGQEYKYSKFLILSNFDFSKDLEKSKCLAIPSNHLQAPTDRQKIHSQISYLLIFSVKSFTLFSSTHPDGTQILKATDASVYEINTITLDLNFLSTLKYSNNKIIL